MTFHIYLEYFLFCNTGYRDNVYPVGRIVLQTADLEENQDQIKTAILNDPLNRTRKRGFEQSLYENLNYSYASVSSSQIGGVTDGFVIPK